jgi:hypothetical protein
MSWPAGRQGYSARVSGVKEAATEFALPAQASRE